MLWFDWRGDDGKKFQYKAEHLSHTSPLSTPFFYTYCTCHFARWELFLTTAACVEWKCIFTSPPFCLLFFFSSLKWMGANALYIHIGADQQEHNRCFKREKVCLQCLFCYAVNRETNTWNTKTFHTWIFIIPSNLFWKYHFWLSLNWRFAPGFGWVHGSSDISVLRSCNILNVLWIEGRGKASGKCKQ